MENLKKQNPVYLQHLLQKLQNEVQTGREFTSKNLPSFIITLMQTVESFHWLSWGQKKQLVIQALQQYNNTIQDSLRLQGDSPQLSLEFLSSIIDTVIDILKARLDRYGGGEKGFWEAL